MSTREGTEDLLARIESNERNAKGKARDAEDFAQTARSLRARGAPSEQIERAEWLANDFRGLSRSAQRQADQLRAELAQQSTSDEAEARSSAKAESRSGKDLSARKPDGSAITESSDVQSVTEANAKISTNETPARATQQITEDGSPRPVQKDPNVSSVRSQFNLPNQIPNELEQFASYSPLFTMACLTPQQFNNPSLYRDGKTFAGTNFENGQGRGGISTSTIVFSSAGRFDKTRTSIFGGYQPEYFVDNFKMTNIAAANTTTGNQNAIGFEFDVFEPYSMGLLLQSMQNAAVSAGYANYLDNAPYLLKLDFNGFTEDGRVLSTTRSKYFVMRLTAANFTVDGSGSRYIVKGVPFSHSGYSDITNTLFKDVNLEAPQEGTVKELLVDPKNPRSLCSVLNRNEKALVESNRIGIPDIYEVQFPETASEFIKAEIPSEESATASTTESRSSTVIGSETSISTDFGNNKIGKSKFDFSQSDGGNFPFKKEDEVTDEDGRIISDKMTIEPEKRSFQFTQSQSITDIITSVVINSKYATDAFNPDNIVDGEIKWFRLDVQIEFLDFDVLIGDYARKITFRVVPFKVQQSVFSNPNTPGIGYDKLQDQIVKGYNYIYTGQNTDILNFDIKIDNLFYTGIYSSPESENPSDQNPNQSGIAEDTANESEVPQGGDVETQTARLGAGRIRPQPDPSRIKGGSGTTSSAKEIAQNFHQAFIEGNSADLVLIDLEILGDPYYLVDSGQNNYFSPVGVTPYILQDGSMNNESNDVYIFIAFRNPADVNTETGMYDFADQSEFSPFSGIYRITRLESLFEGGVFRQILTCVRLPKQSADFDNKPLDIDKDQQTALKLGNKKKPQEGPVDDSNRLTGSAAPPPSARRNQ